MLPWVLVVGIFAFSLGTYNTLPTEFPTHLDLAGEPTRLAPTSFGKWMVLPLVALGMQMALAGLGVFLPKRPDLFNFPEKARLLALPTSYQAPAVAWMRVVLDVTTIMTLLTLGFVQWMLWRAALGHRDTAGLALILVGGLMMAPIILILVSKVNDATIEAERKWKADGSPTA